MNERIVLLLLGAFMVLVHPLRADEDVTAALLSERAGKGTPVVAGAWHAGLDECRAYAESNGLPLVAVWSKGSMCKACRNLEGVFGTGIFKAWRAASGTVFCYANIEDPSPDGVGEATYDWCRFDARDKSVLRAAPFVRFRWVKNGETVVDEACIGSAIRGGLRRGDQPGSPGFGTWDEAARFTTNYISRVFRAREVGPASSKPR